MHKPRTPHAHSTSLPLIILTLIAGIALGWLLRDTLRNSTAQEATPPPASFPTAVAVPSSGAEPGAAAPPTQPAAPTQPPRPTRPLDATAEAGSPWVVTEVIAKMPLAKPVTMQDVKTVPKLKDMALLRYSRLSVQPVTAEEWKIVCRMGGVSP